MTIRFPILTKNIADIDYFDSFLVHVGILLRWKAYSQTLARSCNAKAAWSSWSLTKSSRTRELIDEELPTSTDSASWSLEFNKQANIRMIQHNKGNMRHTYLNRSNISLKEVWQLAHAQLMHFLTTSKIYLYHHLNNKYELVDKSIHHFWLKFKIDLFSLHFFYFGWGLIFIFTFCVKTFSKKYSIDIVEVLNKLVNINLNRIDRDGHSMIERVKSVDRER